LQKAVVNYLRTRHPGVLFTATLGENQDTPEKRISSYEKGYIRGIPDLFIFHKNAIFSGLAIELKSPLGTGSLSIDQEDKLKRLLEQGFDVLVSNNLFEIIERIYSHINKKTKLVRIIRTIKKIDKKMA